jgi:hypothetical protein
MDKIQIIIVGSEEDFQVIPLNRLEAWTRKKDERKFKVF